MCAIVGLIDAPNYASAHAVNMETKHGHRARGELESPRGVICAVPNASATAQLFEEPGP